MQAWLACGLCAGSGLHRPDFPFSQMMFAGCLFDSMLSLVGEGSMAAVSAAMAFAPICRHQSCIEAHPMLRFARSCSAARRTFGLLAAPDDDASWLERISSLDAAAAADDDYLMMVLKMCDAAC